MQADRITRIAALLSLTAIAALSPVRAHVPALDPATVEPGVLDAGAPLDVIARFDDRVPDLASIADDRVPDLASIAGLDVRYEFRNVPAVLAHVTPEAARALAGLPGLAYLEADKPIEFDLETATVASRAAEVWGGDDPLGYDGSGVGVAIVDTGLDGLHPDHAAPGKVGGNWIVLPQQDALVPAPYTVGQAGHGTHVAGIAAGTGQASGGLYRGAAPGATLYGFGVGSATIATPSIAFDWILDNGTKQDPPIRVINNSWHCGSGVCRAFNPDQIHATLATALAQAGFVVTWAAGNNGGDGYAPVINAEATNPAPGIVGVANYDDEDRGKRNGCVVRGSSRGAASQPATWPDLAAPGQLVLSTWPAGFDAGGATNPSSRTPAVGPVAARNEYRVMSGTSMAAPHVAGVAALLLDARPDLTPADVEYLLKTTAYRDAMYHVEPDDTVTGCGPRGSDPRPLEFVRADPGHTYDGSNYVSGHGLVDARAAVEAALAFTVRPPMPDPEPLPDRFLHMRAAVDVQRTFYLRGEDRLEEEPPTERIGARVLRHEQEVTFSTTFAEPDTAGGLLIDVWIGTDHETPGGSVTGTMHFRLEHETGEQVTVLADITRSHTYAPPGTPVLREIAVTFPEPVTFAEGDVLRLALRARSGTPAPDEYVWILYADGTTTPSSLSLGARVVDFEPGSDLHCQTRIDCTVLGGERQVTSFVCDFLVGVGEGNHFIVDWFGPPGSGAGFACDGQVVAACVVPGEADDPWGNCQGRGLNEPVASDRRALCFYITPDGEQVDGHGRCYAEIPTG